MSRRKADYPDKRTMNLFYKPDRTTKPATIMLYVLFVLACLVGFAKFMVLDVLVDTIQAQAALAAEEKRLEDMMEELADFDEVQERYSRYSATEEEETLIDRMDILALLDSAVGNKTSIESISVNGNTVQIQFVGADLAQTAEIVKTLEASPIVASIMVNTAVTTDQAGSAAEGGPAEGDSGEDDPAGNMAPVKTGILIQFQKEVPEE